MKKTKKPSIGSKRTTKTKTAAHTAGPRKKTKKAPPTTNL
jgi:hypothetical protein